LKQTLQKIYKGLPKYWDKETCSYVLKKKKKKEPLSCWWLFTLKLLYPLLLFWNMLEN